MLEIVDSRVVLKEGGEALFPLSILADTAFYSLDRAVHITAEVSNQCKDNTFSSGVCFAEVEVDLPLLFPRSWDGVPSLLSGGTLSAP